MYEELGAVVDDDSVEFRLFFPDADVDASQYVRGGLPKIAALRVTGDFQGVTGGVNWDFAHAPLMHREPHPCGWLYRCRVAQLPEGVYQYKYFVEFENGSRRWCTDPCTKYGGAENENSGFVLGGNSADVVPIARRLPLADLVVYELMPDDFTGQYRGTRAPFDAIRDRLDHLQSIGFNAIQFMPWTAWRGGDFSWGYDPFQFFSVEHRYYNDPTEPLDKLYRLQRLINELHARGVHVLMDGVFNHVSAGVNPDLGFPYLWLYQDPADSPFIGQFGDSAFFEDFDFGNGCTASFIVDCCKYWIRDYCVDGIRFDYVRGFVDYAEPPRGIGRVIRDLKVFCAEEQLENMSFILEHLPDNRYEAVDAMNKLDADGCWYDPLMFQAFGSCASGNVPTSLVRALHAGLDCADGRRPLTYVENHDHSTLTEHCIGGRDQWWRTQPAAIALMTCCGAPMVHNGQEFGEQYALPESGSGRVSPRPLRWERADDGPGRSLRDLYARLIRIRLDHPALRSPNFHPWPHDERLDDLDSEGYGASTSRDIVIFHRWGHDTSGRLERFIVVLNFSSFDQEVDVPFSTNGEWHDLLDGSPVQVDGWRLWRHRVGAHWGNVFFRMD
jgi:1,4-alpha-glucan branching enzyme